ncbi:MAG: hypothetical protein WCA16_10155 [Candidatus Sulfotelmatobacter sp.]
MPTSISSAARRTAWLALALVLASSGPLFAQGPNFVSWKSAALEPPPAAPPVSFVTVSETSRPHRFWDRQNRALFATVAGASAADFYVTHANLASGGRELNPVTRMFCGSTAGLALSFSGQTAGVIGLSYLFHRSGHHKLERLTTLVNISASGAAVAYSASHR